jgi:hypothetical protein
MILGHDDICPTVAVSAAELHDIYAFRPRPRPLSAVASLPVVKQSLEVEDIKK